MNYLPFVSWGVYGSTTDKEMANYFASWGISADLGEDVESSLSGIFQAIFVDIMQPIFRVVVG